MGSFWWGYVPGFADGLLMFGSFVAAFYPWLMCLFHSGTGPDRRDRVLTFRLLLRVCSEVEKIVHRMPEILFTAEIVFCGLHRCVTQQKLDLLQFTTAVVT